MLLALAAGIALYALSVSLRSGPASRPYEAVVMPTLPPLPAPQRLPAGEGFALRAVTATAERTQPSARAVTIELHAVPREHLGSEAGVATFQAETGADFVWTPLQTAEPTTDGGLRIRSTALATGDLMVTLATDRRYARHGYLVRQRIPADSLTTPTQLTVAAELVELLLPAGTDHAGPLQLRRIEDPQWLPMHDASTGVRLATGARKKLLLGAGAYELAAPLAGVPPQTFTVPAAGPVTIRKDLAEARAGRP